jgi:hypothetical protein
MWKNFLGWLQKYDRILTKYQQLRNFFSLAGSGFQPIVD